MKKQSLIRILMLVMIIAAGFFVVAAVRTDRAMTIKEDCMQQDKEECLDKRTHSEFLLESLTRNLLGR